MRYIVLAVVATATTGLFIWVMTYGMFIPAIEQMTGALR